MLYLFYINNYYNTDLLLIFFYVLILLLDDSPNNKNSSIAPVQAKYSGIDPVQALYLVEKKKNADIMRDFNKNLIAFKNKEGILISQKEYQILVKQLKDTLHIDTVNHSAFLIGELKTFKYAIGKKGDKMDEKTLFIPYFETLTKNNPVQSSVVSVAVLK
jgi:hypothetical protein